MLEEKYFVKRSSKYTGNYRLFVDFINYRLHIYVYKIEWQDVIVAQQYFLY